MRPLQADRLVIGYAALFLLLVAVLMALGYATRVFN